MAEFVVKEVVGHRILRNRLQVKINWEGLSSSQDSWEDAAANVQTAARALRQYLNQLPPAEQNRSPMKRVMDMLPADDGEDEEGGAQAQGAAPPVVQEADEQVVAAPIVARRRGRPSKAAAVPVVVPRVVQVDPAVAAPAPFDVAAQAVVAPAPVVAAAAPAQGQWLINGLVRSHNGDHLVVMTNEVTQEHKAVTLQEAHERASWELVKYLTNLNARQQ